MQQRAAARLGMRRIEWVRVVVDEEGPHAELSGVAHRLPRIQRIPLALAASLAAEGVPLLVHHA